MSTCQIEHDPLERAPARGYETIETAPTEPLARLNRGLTTLRLLGQEGAVVIMTQPPSPHITESREGGGYVVTCACNWLRWSASHTDADASRTDHTKRCKVARGEA